MAYTLLETNTTGYYQIEQGASQVLSWSVGAGQWIRFTSSHSAFGRNQTWSIRLWSSIVPEGISITGLPDSNLRWFSPLKAARTFGYYDVNCPAPNGTDMIWMAPVAPDTIYYLNIRNMENKANGFYLGVDILDIP